MLLFFLLVCGELCLHPPQPDLPTGVGVPWVLQQVPPKGRRSSWKEKPHDRMFQPQGRQGSEGGEHQPPHLHYCLLNKPTFPLLWPFSLPQFTFDASQGTLDNSAPSGVKWLCHPSAMQTYLSLLSTSQKDATLEASCGALQNLTASKGLVRTK